MGQNGTVKKIRSQEHKSTRAQDQELTDTDDRAMYAVKDLAARGFLRECE
jgi:hypothetical protein